jgi:hypothetical protein
MVVSKRFLSWAVVSLCSCLAVSAQQRPGGIKRPGGAGAAQPGQVAIPAAAPVAAPVAPAVPVAPAAPAAPVVKPDAGIPVPPGQEQPLPPPAAGAGEAPPPVDPAAAGDDTGDDVKPAQPSSTNEKLISGGGRILNKPEGMTVEAWIDKRTPAVWNWYMHGVPDWFATQLSWSSLLGNHKELLEKQEFSCPVKDFSLSVVRLDGRREVTPIEVPQPLPLPYDGLYGKSIRLHFWLKGTTADKITSDVIRNATLVISSRNGNNDLLSETTMVIPTVGQFEWHGYHIDMAVVSGSKLFLKMVPGEKSLLLVGPFSWEEITAKNFLDENNQQDPETGSLAANPMHDALPFHLNAGFAGRYPYHFLTGATKLGNPLKGQPYNLLTVAGLEAYAKEIADSQDLYQLATGLAMLPRAYYICAQTKLMSAEEKCPAKVFEILAARQNPKTGLWGRSGAPGSLWATRDILKTCYADPLFGRPPAIVQKALAPAPAAAPVEGAPAAPAAAGAAPAAPALVLVASVKFGVATVPPWVKEGGIAVPNAAKLVDTIVGWQGQKQLWPIAALDYPDPVIAAKLSKEWSLLASECAMDTLRLTFPSLPAASRTKAETAIDQAAKALLRQVLDPAGNSRFVENGPTGGAWFFALHALNSSMLFEKRSNPDLPAPTMKRAGHERGIKLTWEKPAPGTVAVRVYRLREADLEAGKPKATVGFDRLCGVICLDSGSTLDKMDPLVSLITLKGLASKSWNYDLVNCELSGLSGCIAKLPLDLVVVKNKEDLILPPTAANDESEFYVAAVDAFGRESAYAKPADAGVSAEEVATPK